MGPAARVAVARAISGSRPLILADEPTGNLDVKSGRRSSASSRTCANDGLSVLMVTGDPVLASMADRMLLLKDSMLPLRTSGPHGGSRRNDMNLESLLTKVLPTMLQSWVALAIFIVFLISGRRFGGLVYVIGRS